MVTWCRSLERVGRACQGYVANGRWKHGVRRVCEGRMAISIAAFLEFFWRAGAGERKFFYFFLDYCIIWGDDQKTGGGRCGREDRKQNDIPKTR